LRPFASNYRADRGAQPELLEIVVDPNLPSNNTTTHPAGHSFTDRNAFEENLRTLPLVHPPGNPIEVHEELT